MNNSIDSFLAEWSAAERAGAADTLDSLLTDDFVGIGPLGFSLSKAEWLARHHQGLVYETFSVDESRVRTYGDVAVVAARHTQRGSAFGNPIPEAVRATQVLVRQPGGWRLASVHLSFVAGTPGAPPLPGAPNRPAPRQER